MLSRRVVLVGVGIAFLAGLLLRFPDYLTAAATAVLAGFAGVQIWAERRKRESDERTANARLSANAFELRTVLGDLILQQQREGWSTGWVETVLAQTPVRDRLEHGLGDAAQASPMIAAFWRSVYLRYQRAVIRLEAVRVAWAGHPFSQAEEQRLTDAREDLRACCHELERVVDPALMAEAKGLGVLPEGV